MVCPLAEKEFNQPSQTCPGEQWTATATDDRVTIAFSHALDWQALDIDPKHANSMTYEIKLADY